MNKRIMPFPGKAEGLFPETKFRDSAV